MVRLAWDTLIVIIFAVIIITGLSALYFALQQRVTDLTSNVFDKVQIVEESDKQRQAGLNIFNNVVKALTDCSLSDGCLCDIYMLDFPDSAEIKLENDPKGIRVKLVKEEEGIVRSALIPGIATGMFAKGLDCNRESNAVIGEDEIGWYAWNPELRFLKTEELFRQNGTNRVCLLTTQLLFEKNETELEDYFKQFPSCKFKASKEKEKAIALFTSFVERYKECFSQNTENCNCEFPAIEIPKGYIIRVISKGKLKFQLYKDPTLALTNESLVTEVEESKADLLIEKGLSLSTEKAEEVCFMPTAKGVSAFKDCKFEEPYFSIDSNTSIYALFFIQSSSVAFLESQFGVLDLSGVTLNRNNIPPCKLAKEGEYSAQWPASIFNNAFYVEECFGFVNGACNRGLKILQKEGSPVYSVDDGLVEEVKEDIRQILIRHKNGLISEYENVLPVLGIGKKAPVKKGQQIGVIIPQAGAEKSYLLFSIIDENKVNIPGENYCTPSGTKNPLLVVEGGKQYYNPLCYIDPDVRSTIVFSEKCSKADCTVYGNEEKEEDIKLRVLSIPVNWGSKESYIPFANDAMDIFIRAIPIKRCPKVFRKLFADGKTDYGSNWSQGSCNIPAKNNCYTYALEAIKECADQYKAITGEDYDFVVGIDDSDIAHKPECNYGERGWTMDGSRVLIVENNYKGDIAHELGHLFGLKDQYCDCSGTEKASFCGERAAPNPLREGLGCDIEGDCCGKLVDKNYPYVYGCRWCRGNLDMNSEDTNSDSILDFGNRTVMSNAPNLFSYSTEEYEWLKLQTKMQCV